MLGRGADDFGEVGGGGWARENGHSWLESYSGVKIGIIYGGKEFRSE